MSSNTNALRLAVAKAKAKRSSNTSGASKGPAWYNRRKNGFCSAMIGHENPIVRMAACSDVLVPVTKLTTRLDVEEDPQVLRAILMNPQLPIKAIEAFSADPRAEVFGEDEELEAYIGDRLS